MEYRKGSQCQLCNHYHYLEDNINLCELGVVSLFIHRLFREFDLVFLIELPLPLCESLVHHNILAHHKERECLHDLKEHCLVLWPGEGLINYKADIDDYNHCDYLQAKCDDDIAPNDDNAGSTSCQYSTRHNNRANSKMLEFLSRSWNLSVIVFF